MILGFGTQCPAYEFNTVGMGDNYRSQCRYCRGRLGVYANGVDCGYSKIPSTEPKFEVGQTVYIAMYPNLPWKIRKREWDGRFCWVYYFSRERTPRPENTVFATSKEAEEAEIREKLERVKSLLQGYCNRYGGSIESVTRRLLPSGEEGQK